MKSTSSVTSHCEPGVTAAGIRVGKGQSLVVDGDGKLDVYCSQEAETGGAGIGGSPYESGGTITTNATDNGVATNRYVVNSRFEEGYEQFSNTVYTVFDVDGQLYVGAPVVDRQGVMLFAADQVGRQLGPGRHLVGIEEPQFDTSPDDITESCVEVCFADESLLETIL